MTRRIGLLRTDSVLPQFQDAHGDYPEMFEAAFADVDPDCQFTSIDARSFRLDALPEPESHDAYLITGSRHSVYDDLDWIPALAEFVRRVVAAKRKVLGICFGHQLIAHFFGGRVAPAEAGWAVGVHESRVIEQHPWMDGDETLALISSHKDQVVALPEQASVYATNAFCPIAGFTMGDEVLTIQGHPEFSKAYSRALMEVRRELIGEGTFEAGVASLALDLDAGRFVRWMINFLDRGDR